MSLRFATILFKVRRLLGMHGMDVSERRIYLPSRDLTEVFAVKYGFTFRDEHIQHIPPGWSLVCEDYLLHLHNHLGVCVGFLQYQGRHYELVLYPRYMVDITDHEESEGGVWDRQMKMSVFTSREEDASTLIQRLRTYIAGHFPGQDTDPLFYYEV